VLNAANEAAVSAFTERRIGFLDIVEVVDEVLQRTDGGQNLATSAGDDVVAQALQIDAGARRVAAEVLARFGRAA
jgi:1-deoxy-D-xylulose-5-phosphate reductoisomerase